MRLYQRDINKVINSIVMFLPIDEAKALIEELNTLIRVPNNYVIKFKGKDKNGKLTKELTIRIYNDENIVNFEESIKTLITKGKIES